MWIVNMTSRDAMNAVRDTARQGHSPILRDWMAALRRVAYLNAISHSEVRFFTEGQEDLAAYANTTYASWKADCRSGSGGVIMYAGGGL